MSDRTFTRRTLLSAAPALIAGRAGGASRPPNVILMLGDDLSARELGCYGHTGHRTPNLDALAKTGTRFETCWASPICSPSRAALMTGRYGFRTGWYHNNLRTKEPLAKSHLTIGQVMKNAGYRTAITGKWQLPGAYEDYGFDEHLMWVESKEGFDGPVEQEGHQIPGRTARYWHPSMSRNGKRVRTTAKDYGPDLSLEFCHDFAARNKERPFFAYYSMVLTHSSWDFDLNRAGWLATPRLDAAGHRVEGKSEHSLKANVEYADYQAGLLIKELERLGLRENTVVMFAGDNGTSGYGKGQVQQERGPRVPMIVNCPGRIKANGASKELVDFTDILPTLADFAGARLPAGYVVDGTSFAPALRGETGKGREWIFSTYAVHRLVRDKRWLLDGTGHLWDCGDRRDETGYRDATNSDDPEARKARERFERVLAIHPVPPEELRRQWERQQQGRKGG